MAIHARSDVVSVTLPVSHGGCGRAHTRPVKDGAPVKLWALTCPQCEDVLRHDPLWSVNIAQLAETPDEILMREEKEKRSVTDQQHATLEALEQLAKLGDLPAVMGQFISFMAQAQARAVEAPEPGFRGAIPARDWHTVEEKAVKEEAPEAPLHTAAPSEPAAAEVLTSADPEPEAVAAEGREEGPYSEMTVPQLRQLARERGITIPVDKRDRQSVIELLQGAGA